MNQRDNEERPNYYLTPVANRYVTKLPETETQDPVFEVECQGLIEALDMNFNLGSALKYLFRAGRKPDEDGEKDLQKALTYLTFELRRRQS
jgi:hypothetical protein